MNRTVVVVALVLLAVAVAGCTRLPAGQMWVVTGNEEHTIFVVAGEPGEFDFTPAEFTVPVGERVAVTLENRGVMDHEIVIPAFEFRLDAPAGWENKTAAFMAVRTGSYEFFCEYPGHYEAGQRGVVHVVDS